MYIQNNTNKEFEVRQIDIVYLIVLILVKKYERNVNVQLD